ncbi:MAG: UDP-3-O-(3-hydroxymyristoyl)glucosamine N-acyltransferase [Rhizomicrobium sp.]
MTDDRFFQRAGPFPLGEIAAHVGAELGNEADAAFPIHDVAALDGANDSDISIFSDAKFAAAFAATRARVVITNHKLSAHEHNGTWLLLSHNPRLAFAQVGHLFYPPPPLAEGLRADLPVHETARVGAGTQIGPGGEIGAHAKVGAHCAIGRNVVIGAGVTLGDHCVIGPNTVISHAIVGSRVTFGPNCSIGNAGFSFVPSSKGLLRVPQLGRVLIEDDVEFGSNCTVDRGAIGDTVIERGARFDALIHVGHNVRVGHHCIVVAQVGIAGSTTIGPGVMIGGQVGISDHLNIGAGARLAAGSGVTRDVAPGETVGGYPAVPVRQWHRQVNVLKKLAEHKKDE